MRYCDGNVVVKPWKLSSELSNALTHQWIDQFGKTRYLFFQYNIIGYLTTPVPPSCIPQPSVDLDALPFPSLDTVLTFINQMCDGFVPVDGSPAELRILEWKGILFVVTTISPGRQIFFPCQKTSIGSIYLKAVLPADIPHISMIVLNFHRSNLVAQFCDTIRLASIIEEYYLHYINQFLNNFNISPDQDIETWIHDFMSEHTLIHDDNYSYPQILAIPTSFQDNVPGLVTNKKIHIARRVFIKLVYFLKWFYIYRKAEVKYLTNVREIPSYYQFVSDFTRHSNQVILNSVQTIDMINIFSFRSDPLSTLDIPFLENVFYYNPSELPMYETPCVIVRVQSRERAIAIAYLWYQEHVLVTNRHIDVPATFIVNEPLFPDRYINGLLQWSNRPDAVGLIAKGLQDTFIAILGSWL
jgi:hypothetical protein